MKFTEKQFKDFMKISNNPCTTFRQKAEEILGKNTTYQEEIDFKEAVNKWYEKKVNTNL